MLSDDFDEPSELSRVRGMHYDREPTYHSSISTFWPKRGCIRGSTSRKSIGKDNNTHAIHPTKLKDQWPKQTGDDIRCRQVDTEP